MILGKRTFFRAIEESDLPLIQEWLNDPAISRLVGGFTFPVSRAEQRVWYERSLQDGRNKRWMVCTTEGETIGLTGLWEIDWVNRNALTALKLGSSSARGQGFGTDAIMTLMSYAFSQVGLHRLWGEIVTNNVASYRAYVTKCGWTVEGTSRQQIFRDGVFYDQLRVGILAQEFLAFPGAAEYLAIPETNRVGG